MNQKKIRDRRLRDVVASEEDKFWKFLTKNTNFNKQLVNLDIRLLTNYYRSLGYYNVKINSSFAKLNDKSNFELIFNITEGKKYFFNNFSLKNDTYKLPS